MSKKLEHAKHNEIVCNFISHKEDFADWIVITAFYSALHYVDHKIFPIKEKTEGGHTFKIDNIDQLYNNLSKKSEIRKHSLRETMVRKHCNGASASFNWLKSTCETARYFNYKFPKPRDTSKTAKDHLAVVKSVCDPPIAITP